MHPYRTHTCGELREEHVGQTVRLSGWVHSVRDHGGIVFIDLRDHYGITQIVINPEVACHEQCRHMHSDTVLCFTGSVVMRDLETVNDRLPTGKVELRPEEMSVLGPAAVLPFPVADDVQYPEHLRLKYRFLDLRRDKLHRNIMLRSQVIAEVRRLMTDMGFNEFQTPILTSSSPEGARDFLVPSRLHHGKFYALPQAPQQFKQLLMVAGFDRYFQIAPCFRDEDSRADRSPGEFYQLDLEMSFVEQDDVFHAVESVIAPLFAKFSTASASSVPYPRIPYAESMLKYGCDKPDLRNPLTMLDVSTTFAASEFKAFAGVVQRGGVVRSITVKGIANQPRKFFDDMIEFAQSVGSKGLGYIGWVDGKPRSPIAKFLSDEQLAELQAQGGAGEGDVMFFIADVEKKVQKIGAEVIKELADRLDLLAKDDFRFCWIVDYPMFELNDETNKIEFSHNPFSMPQGEMEALQTKDPLEILAYQYDLVCNGIELSSGAIRNHRPEIMYKAFEIAGYDSSVVDNKFGGMINAFKLGAPPHGGIAPGIDRIVMLLANEKNIREVIAFPLNQQAQDLMMNAPNTVDERQLRELNLMFRPQRKQQ